MRSKYLPSFIVGIFCGCTCFLLGAPFLVCLLISAAIVFAYSCISLLLCIFLYSTEVRELLWTSNKLLSSFLLGFLSIEVLLSGAEKISVQYALSFPYAFIAVFGLMSIWLVTSTRLLLSLRVWDVQKASFSRMR